MLWVKENIDEVIKSLDVKPETGLPGEEVKKRLEKYGLNEFEEEKKETFIKKVLHHLLTITSIILMAAATIAAIAAVMHMQSDSLESSVPRWAKVVVIMTIVVINVVLGVFQEGKAEKALEALKKMNTFKTTVIRNETKQIIDANLLVPGDIIELNAGDVITADARLIESSSLQVEESALTGESQPVEKDSNAIITEEVPLGDRINMIYSGCLVTGGRATAVVVETAMGTEMGKIAHSLATTKKMETPLQQRLKQLATRISVIAMLSGLIMFTIGFLIWGNEALEMLLLAVALGVAAVPETMPIIVTMILSYGVFNMVRKKTIIRKIPAIETIGNTSVICSDKTGTLTLNKMKIQQFWHATKKNATKAKDNFDEDEIHMLELLASCSNATIEIHGDDDEHVVGDPTEVAIIRLLHDKGLTRVDAERVYPRVHELPFDSSRKRMTTVHHCIENVKDEGYLVVTKGAFDRLPINWDEKSKKKAMEMHDEFADKALRVIGIGYKIYDELPENLNEETLEKDLTFLGLIGMIDPPRPESKAAVEKAAAAGIKTVMITGDHISTAVAIAKEIGIMNEGDRALTGADLANMSDVDLTAQVRGISVYARVSPEDKLRIVRAWNEHNAVVTMTGDGVNDAPALKAADVGAAMGITGTEVSKSAADMIITDDNFATIVDAIAEGRTSYDNIRKTITFLLGVNFAEIFILLIGMITIGRAVITALQILIINVVYDGIPGFFLAFEKAEPGVMKRKPLSKNSGVFAQNVGVSVAVRAVTFSILTIAAFIIGSYVQIANVECLHYQHVLPGVWNESTYEAFRQVCNSLCVPWDGALSIDAIRYGGNFAIGTTMAFLVLSWMSILNALNTRTRQSIFKVGVFTNKGIFFAVIGTLLFSVVVAVTPFLQPIFNVINVSWKHWIIMIIFALIQFFTIEIFKYRLRKKEKKEMCKEEVLEEVDQ